MRRSVVVLLAFGLLGCGGGGGGGGGGGPRVPAKASPLVIAAGLAALAPAPDRSIADGLDLSRLGLSEVDAVYDATTPAGEPFRFEVLSSAPGNTGPVSVSVAHADDGGIVPAGGYETLLDAGIVPNAPAATSRGVWLDSHGDGFARIAITGRIDDDQMIVVASDSASGSATAVVRLRIGAASPINLSEQTAGDYPGLLDTVTLYSSDSPMFGLPTAAVSGDRTSIVCYEGDRGNRENYTRYELRLQHDGGSGTVTGGGSEEASPDSGNWRDHEIAALYNVLALVHSGTDRVTVKLSFDRGASFGQTAEFPAGREGWSPRLVQVAMALDYTLAVLVWDSDGEDRTDLVFVEGRPAETDAGGSPTLFEFDAPVVLHHETGSVTPVPMGVAWSGAGDLVIGYGYSRFTSREDLTWESLTRTHCAVRPFGGSFTDTVVDEDLVVGKDPGVAVLGGGATLAIFLAYEGPDGVRLVTSTDGGRTFSPVVSLVDGSTHTPTVLAREKDGAVRIDLLYLADGGEGAELHLIHWDDYGNAAPGQYRLTTAVSEATAPPEEPVWRGDIAIMPPQSGFRVTQVAWFGYDAVVSGDEVVVVVDEETFEGWFCVMGAPEASFTDGLTGGALPRDFTPAEPPPLAPGMTEPVPAPDPEDMHRLKLLRLE
jgi:hypothetical protein